MGICFEHSFPPELSDLVLFVDPNKIAQVIRNVVSNALKFTPREGQVTIAVSAERRTVLEAPPPKHKGIMPLIKSLLDRVLAIPSANNQAAGDGLNAMYELVLSVTDTGAGISAVSGAVWSSFLLSNISISYPSYHAGKPSEALQKHHSVQPWEVTGRSGHRTRPIL